MKKVLVISSTLRKMGNSELLSYEFIRGAKDSKHQVEFISLYDVELKYCIGCLACQKSNKCIIKDDAEHIIEKMKSSDVIVFATPIYFYEMAGQLKTLLDRTNPIFSTNYSFKDIYLIATAADNSKAALDGAINGLQGWISCFEKSRLAGVVYGVGLTDINEASKNNAIMKQAYEMGSHI